MARQIITPLLLKRERKLYKFLYVAFDPDGSIYLQYPRKNGYEIVGTIDLPPIIKGEVSFPLEKNPTGHTLPKISFHPGKMSIHLNVDRKEIYKADRTVLNMGDGVIAFPLCQIIIPADVAYLDEYVKDKYFKPLEIEIHQPIGSISVHFWVHPPEYHIALDDLPQIEKLKEISTTIIPRQFAHSNVHSYTCTAVIHDIGVRKKVENPSSSIITSIYTDKSPYIFELVPILR